MVTTFGKLLTKCKNITQNASTTNTTILTFLKDEINIATRFIYAYLQDYITLKTATTLSVVNQQYYHLPPDFMNAETVTFALGSYVPNLEIVDSQKRWDWLNALPFQPTAYPKYFFVRRDDFGVWPTPQTAGYTITLNYTYRIKDMTADDYSTGTITLNNGSQLVTGVGTTWTAQMAGRWLIPTTDQYPYRLQTFNSTTSFSLENYFQGSGIAGDAYTIGEVPEIPLELHELIPYHVAQNYFSGFRKDANLGTYWSNMFWTGHSLSRSRDLADAQGGLLGALKRYSARSNNRLIRKNPYTERYSDRVWATTLSDS